MKFNISEKYYTDENTTVCILNVKNFYVAEAYLTVLRDMERSCTKEGKALGRKLEIPREIKGFARLAEGDTFDFSTGRKIAREKAYAKLDKLSKKFEEEIRKHSQEISNNFTMEK